MTRKDYMDGKVTHEQFYSSVAAEAGLDMSKASITAKAKIALSNGDTHLNTIPLRVWDDLGANPVTRSNISRALEGHGDYCTLAGLVCTLKQAVKNAAQA